VERLSEIAEKRGVQNAQVALAWVLAKPGMTSPIVGASKMAHLDQALAALEIRLDESEIKALEGPYEPHPVLGF
jgi:1-deoxyxylulose-5-phosphate synthase